MGSRNEILLNNRLKVSGTAFKVSQDWAYCHGTLLLNTDLNFLHHILRPSICTEKFISTSSRSVSSPVTNLKISHEDFLAQMSNHLQLKPEEVVVDSNEVQNYADKFRSLQWVYQKTPPFTITVKDKILSVDNSNILDFIQEHLKDYSIFKS